MAVCRGQWNENAQVSQQEENGVNEGEGERGSMVGCALWNAAKALEPRKLSRMRTND